MRNDETLGPALLRRPLTAMVQERASRALMSVRIVALTTATVEFLTGRSLPPGTLCTLTIRTPRPLDIELAITATASATRDLFSSAAVIVRVRDRDRTSFETFVARRRVDHWA
jgi:hypothetical protein